MPEIFFNGPDGRLEGRYQHGAGDTPPVGLVLHPHPRHGGTMNNKVAYTLYRVFARVGFSTLRFNFRGVGRSQGRYDEGVGELADAASALDWLQGHNPDAKGCWVAGFSFGAWIAMQLLMRRPEIAGFIAVAPPANRYDFSFLAPCPVPGLIVQGGADDIVPAADVTELAEKLSSQRGVEIACRIIDTAGHFFDENLEDVSQLTREYIENRIRDSAAAEG